MAQHKPDLVIPCDFDEAHVKLDGQVLSSTLDTTNDEITFTVAKGGRYEIIEGPAPLTPAPTPSTPSVETPSVDTSSPVVDSTTTENADGSTTKSETLENGVVVETTTKADGSSVTSATKTEETDKGTVATTETAMSNGSKGITTVDETGKVEAAVTVSSKAVQEAAKSESAIELPMPKLEVPKAAEAAATITVELPAGTASAAVAIPVADGTGAGTVAIIVNADGSETIVTESKLTGNGLEVELPAGATVKVVDNSTDFNDVKAGSWYEDAVDFASARNIMNGTSTTADVFSPNQTTTRAMVWTMLARLSGVDTSAGETWYEAGQKWAMENGISDGTMGNAEITREQLATMLHRYAGAPDSDYDLSDYKDHDQTNDWAKTAGQWAVEKGIINGTSPTTLDPAGDATRAQVAQMIMNYITKL